MQLFARVNHGSHGRKNMKRFWTRPEMVILSRKRSDEFILASCKQGSGEANTLDNGCKTIDVCGTECQTGG
jgi:hypothetical protein